MDYALPRAADMPAFAFETRNVPCKTNPLGVKGAGEAGAIGSCPAVMNAIVDALWRGYRIRHIDMPATPERIWAAIEEARLCTGCENRVITEVYGGSCDHEVVTAACDTRSVTFQE